MLILQSRFSHREILFTKAGFDGPDGLLQILKCVLQLGYSTYQN